MGAQVGFEKEVESGVKVVFGTVLQHFVDQSTELGFEKIVFKLAAGFGKGGCQAL